MTINRTATSTGDRELRRASVRFGDDYRELRLRAGVSQADIARAVGVDRSVICRLERGDADITSRVRARAAAVLGAEFRFGLYAERPALIRDAAHAALVERLLAMRNRRWQATVEATVPGPGRRSSDARLDHAEDIVLTEVESRVGALESIVRESHDKRRAVAEAAPGRRVHVVLVLPPTRHHRALVRAHPETIRAAFPVPSARLVDALSSRSGPWPGDWILWLSARATSSA